MDVIKKDNQSVIPKSLRFIFVLLTIGFTLISAWNGFEFYNIIFGISMAALIISVFEIARLASLFSLIHARGTAGFLSAIIYIIVASVCAFAAINSFTSQVIRQEQLKEAEFKVQINKIKQAYSEKEEEKLVTLNRDIKYLENMVAKYPDRDYWKRRLSQIKINRDGFITERDRFLNENPENPEQWIKAKSALLGLELERLSRESEEMDSVTRALSDLWRLKKVMAQKIMGIVVTITVELSILLLAFLSQNGKNKNVTDRSGKLIREENNIMKIILSNFDEKIVRKFLSVSRDHFHKTGKLPPMRKLSTNMRPVRKLLQEYDKDTLKSLFEKTTGNRK